MSERSRFIRYVHRVRYVLVGTLTLTGLLLPVVSATAVEAPAAVVTDGRDHGNATDADVGAGLVTDADTDPAIDTDVGSAIDDTDGTAEAADTADTSGASDTAETVDTGVDLSPEEAARAAGVPRNFEGRGFDTCQAPSLATMRAWRASSPYRAVGIYFGGRARACKTQHNLTKNWVRKTGADGWSLLPIYVGSQSPCVRGSNKNPYRIDSGRAWAQGLGEGKDAVRAAGALGLKSGSALYLDMEAYNLKNVRCADATLEFVRAWDRQVRARGYLPAFYSSADSGIAHMEKARRAGTPDLPGAVWYARWGVKPTLTDEPVLRAAAWASHRRIHQYTGSVTETHGGHKLAIDRDLIDAPVAKL